MCSAVFELWFEYIIYVCGIDTKLTAVWRIALF